MRQVLLQKIAAELKDYGQFTGSKWQNYEAEVLAMQTLGACALNLEKHNKAFSWLMSSAMIGNNYRGMQKLVDDGSIEIVDYTGLATPPDDVERYKGVPQMCVVTDSLLLYAASLLKLTLDDLATTD